MVAFADKPLLHFTEAVQWEEFLRADPPDGGVRLLLLKKAAVVPGIRYPEALDVALCHGWIDGQVGRYDDDFTAHAFTPRRARSPWSQINREHTERLIAAGRMTPAGQAEIDRARADGRWDAAYRQKGAVVPDDLRAALDAEPAAAAAWEALDGQNRFAILFRVGTAKLEATGPAGSPSSRRCSRGASGSTPDAGHASRRRRRATATHAISASAIPRAISSHHQGNEAGAAAG